MPRPAGAAARAYHGQVNDLRTLEAWLADRFPALAEAYGVPGAAVAILADGEMIDAATGVLNLATGVEATPDSVFQIGSITKLWTAALVMQLVDEGRLDLDQPVRTYLPEFRVADEAAAATITTRQLLSHTAGFEGDIFTDTGKGDDCLEKFVLTLGDTAQLFPPGERFSYNNAGYCVLGRLVEVLREKTYDDCLREHLFGPLGLTHAATGPYEAIMFRAAMGHVRPAPGAELQVAPVWALARSNAPAGSMLAMRPRDLLAFAQMHINAGQAADGTVVLQPETVRLMHEPCVELPRLGLMGDAWGLGSELFLTPEGVVTGHDGNTIGQAAFLRFLPGQGGRGGPPHQRRQRPVALSGHRQPRLRGAGRSVAAAAPGSAGAAPAHRRESLRGDLFHPGVGRGREPGGRRAHLARADPQGHLRRDGRDAPALRARQLRGG